MAVKKMTILYTLFLCLITVMVRGAQGCLVGFNLTNGECKDIDECNPQPSVCGHHASCYNTAGSYGCRCLKGFQSTNSNYTAGDPKCQDIDECAILGSICGENSIGCHNTPGSFICNCTNGFIPSRVNFKCQG
ncbi:adhesion G protein-coupled receptor E1-like [Engraulis encrasicolus]|uniref:adhesion G protein-coupled receptor E1-like n=1 Tax=Engraulis encrasicolus TaxID=184585 RepID=UPI002FD32D0D